MTVGDRMSPVIDGELYELHGRALVAFAASLVGPSDAPDVVHDAAMALFESGTLAEAVSPRALMYSRRVSSMRTVFS